MPTATVQKTKASRRDRSSGAEMPLDSLDFCGWVPPGRDCHSKPDADQVAACVDWLRKNAKPSKNMRSSANSYALKHRAERDVGQYVSNGALIKAALSLGYRYRRENQSPNCIFNMILAKSR